MRLPPAYDVITPVLLTTLAFGFIALRVLRDIDGVASFDSSAACMTHVASSDAFERIDVAGTDRRSALRRCCR